jgi:ATP-dependent RNA helicase DDX19/DBP5
MMLFSATYDVNVMNFAENIIKDPVVIRLRKEEESLDNIGQYWVDCATPEAKFNAISNIYGVVTIGQAMIFCQTRNTAKWLVEKMTAEGHAVALLSGELSVEDRISILDRFRDGLEKILITTNVMARGIDVEQVTIVVNYDMPTDKEGNVADYETYLHRIGRTGRFGKHGLAINLIDSEKSLKILNAIENHFGKQINKLDVNDPEDIEKIQKD